MYAKLKRSCYSVCMYRFVRVVFVYAQNIYYINIRQNPPDPQKQTCTSKPPPPWHALSHLPETVALLIAIATLAQQCHCQFRIYETVNQISLWRCELTWFKTMHPFIWLLSLALYPLLSPVALWSPWTTTSECLAMDVAWIPYPYKGHVMSSQVWGQNCLCLNNIKWNKK